MRRIPFCIISPSGRGKVIGIEFNCQVVKRGMAGIIYIDEAQTVGDIAGITAGCYLVTRYPVNYISSDIVFRCRYSGLHTAFKC